MKNIVSDLRISLVATLALGLIVCGIYPVIVWGLAQTLFPYQSNGSLIVQNGEIVGSELIAQNFVGPQYFHPRPSFAGDTGYDAAHSGGSNLGPLSKELLDSVSKRVQDYRTENNLPGDVPVPADAVTASASGLDPDISMANALLQAGRVAKARGLTLDNVKAMIRAHTRGRDLGLLGEERVNVLKLNLALDGKP
jgi:K+-transporting ATPase ATPase C chain